MIDIAHIQVVFCITNITDTKRSRIHEKRDKMIYQARIEGAHPPHAPNWSYRARNQDTAEATIIAVKTVADCVFIICDQLLIGRLLLYFVDSRVQSV